MLVRVLGQFFGLLNLSRQEGIPPPYRPPTRRSQSDLLRNSEKIMTGAEKALICYRICSQTFCSSIPNLGEGNLHAMHDRRLQVRLSLQGFDEQEDARLQVPDIGNLYGRVDVPDRDLDDGARDTPPLRVDGRGVRRPSFPNLHL